MFGKIVPDVGSFAGIPLQLIEVRDPKASQAVALSNNLTGHRLYEWWCVPVNRFTWPDKIDLEAMLALYGVCEVKAREAQRLRELICWKLLPQPTPQEFWWYYIIREVENSGTVIAIIFGDKFAMDRFWTMSGQNAPAKALN